MILIVLQINKLSEGLLIMRLRPSKYTWSIFLCKENTVDDDAAYKCGAYAGKHALSGAL